jgi:hypothetical protein
MSVTTSKENKATALAAVRALIAGTQKHFPNGQFTLGNVAYTTASLVQTLQGLVDAFTALAAAHASVTDGVAALRAMETKVGPLLREYVTFLRATFSTAAAPLGDFGLQPPKAHQPLSTEKRAAATAKARATRAARGTTSKKQKLAIKGDVTGVVVTPITTPAPSPSPVTPVTPVTPAGAAPVANASSVVTK